MKPSSTTIRVAELFAGVGGFRIGLENANKKSKSSKYEIVWSNQWEPATKAQHASDIYVKRFGDEHHSNEDIATVLTKDIPDHDLLVGGFPCQDYSVATTLKQSSGLVGKKGVLWWQIHRILLEKKYKPPYLLLENVDRLLKSPASQRGRDFAVMLASLADLGYIVEWRVVNAADYGMPQRRKRVFLLGYHQSTAIAKRIIACSNLSKWISEIGTMARALPIEALEQSIELTQSISGNLVEISETFNVGKSASPFLDSGIMMNRKFQSYKTVAKYKGKVTKLKNILLPESQVPEEFFIEESDLEKWSFLKGAKNIERISKATGHAYKYSEGAITYPDNLEAPSRTIITGEGGKAPSRFKHVVKTKSGRLRRLVPVELERLNMFPDNHTEGALPAKRAFFMGNALVTGVVDLIGSALLDSVSQLEEEKIPVLT